MTDVAGDLRVNQQVVIPAEELRWRFSRSSGPGGQGVNTTDSRVEVSWNAATSAALADGRRRRILERLGDRLVAGTITVVAADSRSQWQNRRTARLRLAQIVAAALAPPPRPRRATRPSRGSVERRLAAKQRRSATKARRSRPAVEE